VIPPQAHAFYEAIGNADALIISYAEHNGLYGGLQEPLRLGKSHLRARVSRKDDGHLVHVTRRREAGGGRREAGGGRREAGGGRRGRRECHESGTRLCAPLRRQSPRKPLRSSVLYRFRPRSRYPGRRRTRTDTRRSAPSAGDTPQECMNDDGLGDASDRLYA
jgi:hypothetical protein